MEASFRTEAALRSKTVFLKAARRIVSGSPMPRGRAPTPMNLLERKAGYSARIVRGSQPLDDLRLCGLQVQGRHVSTPAKHHSLFAHWLLPMAVERKCVVGVRMQGMYASDRNFSLRGPWESCGHGCVFVHYG